MTDAEPATDGRQSAISDWTEEITAALQQFASQLATTAAELSAAAESLGRETGAALQAVRGRAEAGGAGLAEEASRQSFEQLIEAGRTEIRQAVAEAGKVRQSLEDLVGEFR